MTFHIAVRTRVAAPRAGSRRALRSANGVLPGWKVVGLGSLCWAVVMAASAAWRLSSWGWQNPEKIEDIAGIFGLGGLIAFPIAMMSARFVSRRRNGRARFAAALLALTTVTIGVTALVYAGVDRAYDTQWHGLAFSKMWFVEQAFTIAEALAQFAVSGLRLYFPIGFAALAGAATWFAVAAR